MSLYIQDPSFNKSEYLHEALISACVGKTTGGGAYAFASKNGVELLIEDDNFKQFLKNGKYLLIVGMDEITNLPAIETLKKLQDKYEGHLQVKAYIHNSKGSTFHPKYSWFANEEGGTLILGSGNLTQKGLRQNREAYAIEQCTKEEIAETKKQWDEWVSHSKMFLFDLNDDIVRECAVRNTKRMNAVVELQKKVGRSQEVKHFVKYLEILNGTSVDLKDETKEKAHEVIFDEDLDIDLPYWTIYLNKEVLIAEIPKSGTRWQQVNFDKKSFEKFFGATCGENGVYRILFRNMRHDGILSEIEIRPSVSVASQNYRFELDAAKGHDYPSGTERPLGVFVKISPRDFMYELVMPGDEAYSACIEVLNDKEAYAANRMRRIRFLCQEIYEKTPQLALWKRLDVEEDE